MCYVLLHLIGSLLSFGTQYTVEYINTFCMHYKVRRPQVDTSAAHYQIPAKLALPSCATSLFASKHSNEGHYLFGLYGWPLQPGPPTVPPDGS